MSATKLIRYSVAIACVGSACATRVGNPPKPPSASANVPIIGDLIPEAAASEVSEGGFAGSADFLKSLSAASPNHRDVLTGVNALGAYLAGLPLEIDVPYAEVVDGNELKIVVRGDAADAAVRRAVMCVAGKPFYQSSWREGSSDVAVEADLRRDYLGAFSGLAEEGRQFSVGMNYVQTDERRELDATMAGVPVNKDPFVGDFSSVVERTRYRVNGADPAVVFQTLQTWYEGSVSPSSIPQVTVAGRLVGGSNEYAIHHTEAKLVCSKPFDRASVAAPGWCVGFAAGSDGKGDFTTPEAAQLLWEELQSDGLIDPASTLVPRLAEVCPE